MAQAFWGILPRQLTITMTMTGRDHERTEQRWKLDAEKTTTSFVEKYEYSSPICLDHSFISTLLWLQLHPKPSEVDLRDNMLTLFYSRVIELLNKLMLLVLTLGLMIGFGNWLRNTEQENHHTWGPGKGVLAPWWHREVAVSLWEILPIIRVRKLYVTDLAVVNNCSKWNGLPIGIY